MLSSAAPLPPCWSGDSFYRSFFDLSPVMMGVIQVLPRASPSSSPSSSSFVRSSSSSTSSGSLSPVTLRRPKGKGTELSVAPSRRSHEATVENTPEGLGDLLHIQANEAVARLLNRPLTDIIGRRSSELGRSQESIDSWIRKCEEARQAKEPITWDFPYPTNDGGKPRWLYGVIYPLPNNPTNDGVYCYVLRDVTERKELEHLMRENELKMRYAANVLHHVDGIVWETDSMTGEVTYINTQKTSEILGKEIVIGKSISAQLIPILKGTNLSVQDTGFVHSEGDSRSKYEFFVDTNGSPSTRKWFRNVVSEVWNYQSKPPKAMRCGIAMDITYEKMNEELAREITDMTLKSKLKSDFFATMSHEIRTPMNGIFGMGELLLDTKLTAEQLEFAEAIINCAHSVLCIVNDILDFSKIEAGKLELYEVPFSLRSVIDETMEIMAVKAKEKDVDLHVHYAIEAAHHYIGDAARIRQVLTNLLANAIKFTHLGSVDVHVELVNTEEADNADPILLATHPKNAQGSSATHQNSRRGSADSLNTIIDVTNDNAIRALYQSRSRRRNSMPGNGSFLKKRNMLREDDSGNAGNEGFPTHWIKIKVIDTGIGISETRLLSLFKKFEQGDASTAVTFGGSGLGLAISKELVELMGGKMGVASAIGVGSCFHFTIPLRRDLNRQARLTTPIPGGSRLQPLLHRTSIKVLIADEDRIFCETLRVELMAWGFIVECFTSEESAMHRYVSSCIESQQRPWEGFRVAFVSSDFESLIATVRQRKTISQTHKWASVSLGSVGTTQPRKARSHRSSKDSQFHSLETALQRHHEATSETHLVQVSQIKRFTEANGEGILFKPVRLAKLHKLLRMLLSDHDEEKERERREKQRERRKAKERLKRKKAGRHHKRSNSAKDASCVAKLTESNDEKVDLQSCSEKEQDQKSPSLNHQIKSDARESPEQTAGVRNAANVHESGNASAFKQAVRDGLRKLAKGKKKSASSTEYRTQSVNSNSSDRARKFSMDSSEFLIRELAALSPGAVESMGRRKPDDKKSNLTWKEMSEIVRARSDSCSPPSNSPSGSGILSSSSSSTLSSSGSTSDLDDVETEEEEDREEEKKKRALILVVDDNMVNQKVIGRFLAKIGLENIITASDGKQAIDIVIERKHEIKLIFMDCRMPILDGYEATRILRREKKITIPIVAVTANNRNEENENLCFQSGMNDYVEKPIRFSDISKIVSKYILKGKGGTEAYVH